MKRSTKLKIGSVISFIIFLAGIGFLNKVADHHVAIGVLLLFISKDLTAMIRKARNEKN